MKGRPVMRGRCDDPFADFMERGDFDLYAADGNCQHAATHDPKREDEVERKKGIRRGKTRRHRVGKPMTEAANFIGRTVERATRFIRWLRAHIYSEAPLRVSAARLAAVWGC